MTPEERKKHAWLEYGARVQDAIPEQYREPILILMAKAFEAGWEASGDAWRFPIVEGRIRGSEQESELWQHLFQPTAQIGDKRYPLKEPPTLPNVDVPDNTAFLISPRADGGVLDVVAITNIGEAYDDRTSEHGGATIDPAQEPDTGGQGRCTGGNASL